MLAKPQSPLLCSLELQVVTVGHAHFSEHTGGGLSNVTENMTTGRRHIGAESKEES